MIKLSTRVDYRTLVKMYPEDHLATYEIDQCTGKWSIIQCINNVRNHKSMFQMFFEVDEIEEALNLTRKILESSEGNTITITASNPILI